MQSKRLLFAAMFFLFSSSCAGSSLHQKPKSQSVNDAVTQLWAQDIRRVAQDGDWLLTRSYSAVGDVIVGVTRGKAFSHASIYDAKREMVIEAIRPRVREVTLEQFLARNQYVSIVRPDKGVVRDGSTTVVRARSVIGAEFDSAGVVGLGKASAFYCSELVQWASGLPKPLLVTTPADLYEKGELIYESGDRGDRRVQRIARARP